MNIPSVRRSAQIALLSSLATLSACLPGGEQVTLGPPAPQALKTSELASDGEARLKLLAQQTDLSVNAVFTNYRKRNTARWNQGWPRRIDLTGVSWSQTRAGTAITPRHILLAAHYTIKKDTTISFHDRAGNAHNRKILKTISFRKRKDEARSDVAISLLDRPLPPSIKTYRLLPPRMDYPHTLPGTPVLVTEQKRRVFIHQVRHVNKNSIAFKKNPEVPEALYKSLIKGDSGHPSFILVGGEPVLIQAHTGGGPGSGPFYSSPILFAAIEKAVAELDPSYRIKTVPLNPKLAPAPPKPEKLTLPRTQVNPTPARPSNESGPQKPRIPRVRRVPVPQGSE